MRTSNGQQRTERFETVVVGGGQAGLSVGYHLKERGRPFVILDASERIGDAWRDRWDSLRLFTPARYDGLDGLPFPAPPDHFPTKDEMADYLESYAGHFDLPVRSGVRVERLSRPADHFVLEAGDRRFEAENVVVAMGNFQHPRRPGFAPDLDAAIVQVHSADYRNPSQLQDGDVLVVGAGNSGAEIALELSDGHRTWLAGRSTGQIPFRIESAFGRHVGVRFVIGFLFHHVLTVGTPMGRKVRPKILSHGGPLVRTKARDLEEAGVQRVGRVSGVRGGLPLLEDGQVLDVANVIWATGLEPRFPSWIDLPVHGDVEPAHDRGIVPDEPGLYFVGLHFQSSLSSTTIRGVGRDAERVAEHVATHRPRQGRVRRSEGRRTDVPTTVA